MPVGNNSTVAKPGSRLRELGLVLPKPPSSLGVAITAITIAAAWFGVTGSARAQSNKTTPADLRAIKVRQMKPAAIRLPII